jgi:hypothetical protein
MPAFPLKTSMKPGLLRATLGCALAVVVLGAAPARAQEETFEQKALDSIMGVFGMTRGNTGPTIAYRERSPLVIPPSANASLGGAGSLPPPASEKVADPNWPIDPEIKKERALARLRKEGDGRTSSQVLEDNKRPLLPSELERGRTNRTQNNSTGSSYNPDKPGSDRGSIWSELGYKGGVFNSLFKGDDDDVARFTGEPPRTSLTAPPSGYQTPSASQPYAMGKTPYRNKAEDSFTKRGTEHK